MSMASKTRQVIVQLNVKLLNKRKPMTVAQLIAQLQEISDTSAPVFLESGEAVTYTSYGMNKTETMCFIGVL
jgi:hypothetical protein